MKNSEIIYWRKAVAQEVDKFYYEPHNCARCHRQGYERYGKVSLRGNLSDLHAVSESGGSRRIRIAATHRKQHQAHDSLGRGISVPAR